MIHTDQLDKVALVTGGAHRIGSAICANLHRHGYRIIIHYHQSETAAKKLAARFNTSRPESAFCLAANLDNPTDIAKLIAACTARWGRLDAVINNASRFYPTPLASASQHQWDDLINSNLRGAFFLCQAAVKALQQTQGTIINIIDINSERALNHYSIYCIAKAGLAMLTQSLAKELAPIRVNGISPGAILWPEQQGEESLTDRDKQTLLSKIPLARLGEPEDIAKTVLFLAQDAPYITGQIIAVDGGRSL